MRKAAKLGLRVVISFLLKIDEEYNNCIEMSD